MMGEEGSAVRVLRGSFGERKRPEYDGPMRYSGFFVNGNDFQVIQAYAKGVDIKRFTGTGYVHLEVPVPERQTIDNVAEALFGVLLGRGRNSSGESLGLHPYHLVRHTSGAYLVVGVGSHPDVCEYPPVRVVAVMEPQRNHSQLRVTPVGYDASQKLVEVTPQGFKPRIGVTRW